MRPMEITSSERYDDINVLNLKCLPNVELPVVVTSEANSKNRDQFTVLLKGTAKLYDPNNTLMCDCEKGHNDDTVFLEYTRGVYKIVVGEEGAEHICFSKRDALVEREELKMESGDSSFLENKKCILVVFGDVLLNGVPISGPYLVGVHSPTVQVVSQTKSIIIGIK